jgi:uncharacterized protein
MASFISTAFRTGKDLICFSQALEKIAPICFNFLVTPYVIAENISFMKSIAIIGASANPEKFGNKAVRAFVQQGWTVYPINPKESTIEGLKAYPSVRDIPQAVEEASIYLAPHLVPAVLQEIAAKGIKKVWLNPGTESDTAMEKAEELGLEAIVACSIVGAGVDPDEL